MKTRFPNRILSSRNRNSNEKYEQKNFLKELGWSVVSTDIKSELITIENYFDPYLNKTYDRYENSLNLIIDINCSI